MSGGNKRSYVLKQTKLLAADLFNHNLLLLPSIKGLTSSINKSIEIGSVPDSINEASFILSV